MPVPLPALESFGASAESCVEISIALAVQVAGVFVLQLIAVVNVKDCGPVPAGGAIPGDIVTVNFHVVFDGTITPLSAWRIVKLPFAPVPGGDKLRGDRAARPYQPIGACDRAANGSEAALAARGKRAHKKGA